MMQPTFPDGPAVPLMVEGVINSKTLIQLFADLESAASGILVREKGSPTAYTNETELTLPIALARLMSGEARAVQIRYFYDDAHWTDTILVTPTGFRVVRCTTPTER